MKTSLSFEIKRINICILLNQDLGAFKGISFSRSVKWSCSIKRTLVEDSDAFSDQVLEQFRIVLKDNFVDNGVALLSKLLLDARQGRGSGCLVLRRILRFW